MPPSDRPASDADSAGQHGPAPFSARALAVSALLGGAVNLLTARLASLSLTQTLWVAAAFSLMVVVLALPGRAGRSRRASAHALQAPARARSEIRKDATKDEDRVTFGEVAIATLCLASVGVLVAILPWWGWIGWGVLSLFAYVGVYDDQREQGAGALWAFTIAIFTAPLIASGFVLAIALAVLGMGWLLTKLPV